MENGIVKGKPPPKSATTEYELLRQFYKGNEKGD